LDDGFNDDVAIGKVGSLGRALETGANGFRRFFQRALLRQLRQRLLNSSKAFIEKFLFDFEDSDTEPRSSRDLGDARAHQAATENADFLDIHTFPLTQRTQGNTEEIEIPV